MTAPGRLAIVLHTHMPYVEGFGTWPFGEEWLWEAMATSYLPLLDVLETGAPVTLSLTPVLGDQLQAAGVAERFTAFLGGVRPASHRLDAEQARADGDAALAAELERAAGQYEDALRRFEALGGDLLGALAPYAAWTSAATHAVLPLLATDAGARLQVRGGVEAHRRRIGAWRGGFWLPECAWAPWLEPLLVEAGVRAVCVDLTDVLGRGAPEQLRPLRTPGGLTLVPIDRAIVELVWSEGGYPAHAAYRDSHRRTRYERRPWANDGAVYDPDRAAEQARADAAEFVTRVRERVAGGGLCVCALDTELLGDWWHEGVTWLAAVVEQARVQGLEIVALDDALAELGTAPAPPDDALAEPGTAPAAPDLPVTSWGAGRDLSTWDAPAVAELAWLARRAELDVVAAGRAAPLRAVRELLALQSSDWAFAISQERAAPYGRERAREHAEGVRAALAAPDALEPELRHVAPWVTLAPLTAV